MHCLPFSLFCPLLSQFLANCCPLDSTEPFFWTVSPTISFWRNHLSSLGLPYYPHQHRLNPLSPPVLLAAPCPPHLLNLIYLFDKDKLYFKKKNSSLFAPLPYTGANVLSLSNQQRDACMRWSLTFCFPGVFQCFVFSAKFFLLLGPKADQFCSFSQSAAYGRLLLNIC